MDNINQQCSKSKQHTFQLNMTHASVTQWPAYNMLYTLHLAPAWAQEIQVKTFGNQQWPQI